VSRLTTLTKLGYLRHNMRLGSISRLRVPIGYPLLASMNALARPMMRSRRLLQRLGFDGGARPAQHGVRRDLPQRRHNITT
jgi:hypothetical protein